MARWLRTCRAGDAVRNPPSSIVKSPRYITMPDVSCGFEGCHAPLDCVSLNAIRGIHAVTTGRLYMNARLYRATVAGALIGLLAPFSVAHAQLGDVLKQVGGGGDWRRSGAIRVVGEAREGTGTPLVGSGSGQRHRRGAVHGEAARRRGYSTPASNQT